MDKKTTRYKATRQHIHSSIIHRNTTRSSYNNQKTIHIGSVYVTGIKWKKLFFVL